MNKITVVLATSSLMTLLLYFCVSLLTGTLNISLWSDIEIKLAGIVGFFITVGTLVFLGLILSEKNKND